MSKRAKLVAIFGVAALLWIGGCLFSEFYLLAIDEKPFTSWWREVWAKEGGPIFLVGVLVSHILGWLGGHFFWAPRKTYDEIRDATYLAALEREKAALVEAISEYRAARRKRGRGEMDDEAPLTTQPSSPEAIRKERGTGR